MQPLTKPALLAAIAYVLLALTVILPFNIGDGQPHYNLKYRALLLLLMIIPMVLSVYATQCWVVGKCHTLAWVYAILIALWVLLFVLTVILGKSRVTITEGFKGKKRRSAPPPPPPPANEDGGDGGDDGGDDE